MAPSVKRHHLFTSFKAMRFAKLCVSTTALSYFFYELTP